MLEQTFLHQQQYSLQLRRESWKTRREFLKKLEASLHAHLSEVTAALAADFNKPEAETLLTEIYPVLKEIHFTQKSLKKWMKPHKAEATLLFKLTRNQIMYEPRGVCLIISPWNYPLQLTLAPLVSALAAGNCAIVKPSEFTPRTNQVLRKIIQEAFSEEHVTMVEGGPEITTQLLELPFDHIFFTGSTRVGKIVMTAAAKHLSSVTLELGGKSPTIVDSSAEVKFAAERIVWSKFMNAGQTCIAPDYLLVHHDVWNDLKAALIHEIEKFYGKSPQDRHQNKDFPRIISRAHTERLQSLIKDAQDHQAEVTFGGDVDLDGRYVSPTLIEKVPPQAEVMKQEIFGPLLPVIPFKEISEAIHFINERPKPLALYIFSHSEWNIHEVLKQTSSGGVCVNDALVHFANSHLPFGGVGESGLGSYHGFYGFKAFSHEKPVLRQSRWGKILRLIYPPYTKKTVDLMRTLIHWKV